MARATLPSPACIGALLATPSWRVCPIPGDLTIPDGPVGGALTVTGSRVKKSGHAIGQGRPDVLRQGQRWFDGPLDLGPELLVFIDETWTATEVVADIWTRYSGGSQHKSEDPECRNERTIHRKFKARVALDAIREEMTLAELPRTYGVHANQISPWKRAAIENMATTFTRG